jgi:hypothetical protein
MKHLRVVGVLVMSLLATSLVLASSALAHKCPNMPRVEQITFKESEPILVDHRKNSAHGENEKAIGIGEFEGEPFWKSPNPGEITKNWPVAYARGKEMLIQEVKLAVSAEAKTFLETETEEPPKPKVVGEVTVKGTKITFTREYTIAEIKTQLAAHATYLTTGEMTTNTTLPNEVFYESATINWKWVVKEKGGATIEPTAGTSTHNLYTTYEKPLAGTEIFLTILDLDTQNIEKEVKPPTEAGVIKGTWKGFSTLEGAANIPSVHIRAYNAATGAWINRSGTVLWYWSEQTPNTALSGKSIEEDRETEEAEELASECGSLQTAALLERLKGTCDWWAAALKNALAVEGLKSEIIQLQVKYAGGEGKICEAGFECAMLVKNWTFKNPGMGEFPYAPAEVVRTKGVPGQGLENPPAGFYNHFIVKAGPTAGGMMYDPSYGAGPFSGGATPTEKSVLEEFQSASLDGFCRPKAVGEIGRAPTACQTTPAKLQLKGFEESGKEGFTFP